MDLALGYQTGVPWNAPEYSNSEFDGLLAKAEVTLDVKERKLIMRDLVGEAFPGRMDPEMAAALAASPEIPEGFADLESVSVAVQREDYRARRRFWNADAP